MITMVIIINITDLLPDANVRHWANGLTYIKKILTINLCLRYDYYHVLQIRLQKLSELTEVTQG